MKISRRKFFGFLASGTAAIALAPVAAAAVVKTYPWKTYSHSFALTPDFIIAGDWQKRVIDHLMKNGTDPAHDHVGLGAWLDEQELISDG